MYQCASSIANMTEHAYIKVELVPMGVLRCLITLCKHESFQAVKRETVQAFLLLSCALENSVCLFDKGILSNVIDWHNCLEEVTCTDKQRGYKPEN